jgi:DNA-binding CsgD family transcriptional regulator
MDPIGEKVTPEPLSPTVTALYQRALQAGTIREADAPEVARDLSIDPTEVLAGLETLLELNLLRQAIDEPDVFIPSSPDSAVAELVDPIESEAQALKHRAETLRTKLLPLRPLYFESRQSRNRREAIDIIESIDQVRLMLSEMARNCTVEVFSAHPRIFSQQAIEVALPNDLNLVKRGVRMRSLFQHPVRVNTPMREMLAQLGHAGAEIRTCDEIPDRSIIFDREIAVIPAQCGSGGAVVIREPATVDFIYRRLELSWSSAVPYDSDPAGSLGYGRAGEDLKRSIIHMLAAGAKDEMIARRLSLSLRTCRRHIAEIMEDLNASSRFQAGVLTARNGLLDEEGRPGTARANLIAAQTSATCGRIATDGRGESVPGRMPALQFADSPFLSRIRAVTRTVESGVKDPAACRVTRSSRGPRTDTQLDRRNAPKMSATTIPVTILNDCVVIGPACEPANELHPALVQRARGWQAMRSLPAGPEPDGDFLAATRAVLHDLRHAAPPKSAAIVHRGNGSVSKLTLAGSGRPSWSGIRTLTDLTPHSQPEAKDVLSSAASLIEPWTGLLALPGVPIEQIRDHDADRLTLHAILAGLRALAVEPYPGSSPAPANAVGAAGPTEAYWLLDGALTLLPKLMTSNQPGAPRGLSAAASTDEVLGGLSARSMRRLQSDVLACLARQRLRLLGIRVTADPLLGGQALAWGPVWPVHKNHCPF